MLHSRAYASARASSRLATATRSTFSDACAPGITFRLMSAVETMPHFTMCVLSRNGADRRGDARVRLHGEGALERIPEDLVRHLAAAARAAADRDRGPQRAGRRRGRA